MQYVSLDSTSFVIDPEIKATDITFSALKPLSLCHLFQDNEMLLVESKEAHCIYTERELITVPHLVFRCVSIP